MKAVIEIDSDNPDILRKSIEIDERETGRVRISSKEEDGKLIVEIDADDFPALRAGVTSYMRLAKTCLDVV